MHLVALKNFLLSKIKEVSKELTFTYFKFQKPNSGQMHVNNFDLSYGTELFCELFRSLKPLTASPASGLAQDVCCGGALSRAGPPFCALASFNTALGEQAAHLGPLLPAEMNAKG